MALQVSQVSQWPAAGYRQNFLGAMEGNDELEEGEASEANDSNYGSDLYFPQIEDKLTEVLGHARKDFEGGLYAEKLGSKYGLYGTFLPTVPTAHPPPPWGRSQGPPAAAPSSGNLEAAKQAAPPTAAADSAKKPSPQVKVAPGSTGELKKTSSITLRIKKNTAIYNRLGFSSPSVSEEDDDDDGMSGSESSPDRSPASMIQVILSHRLPAEGLLSPLPDLLPSPYSKSGVKVPVKEERRKQIRVLKVEGSGSKDAVDDKRELDLQQKQVKQKEKSKGKEDCGKAGRAEDVRGHLKLQEKAPLSKVDVKEVTVVKPTIKPRREETSVEAHTGSYLDKRKSKDAEPERLKKKHKSNNSSAGSLETNAKKPRKQSAVDDNQGGGKLKDEKKKSVKVAKAATDSVLRDLVKDDRSDEQGTKAKAAKVKVGKSKKDPGELYGREAALDMGGSGPSSDLKFTEPPPVPEAPVVPPPAVIEENWVECDLCHQWRLLPPNMDTPKPSDRWLCEMITWLPAGMNNCRFTEDETTCAVYRSLETTAMASVPPAAPAPHADVLKPVYTKKVEEAAASKSRASDVKLGKNVVVKKEKLKQQLPAEVDEIGLTSKGVEAKYSQDKTKKKKRALTEENHASKKLKADDGKRVRNEISNENSLEEDVDSYDRAGIRKVTFKQQDDRKPSKKVVKAPEVDKSKCEEERDDQKEIRRNGNHQAVKAPKICRPEKGSKKTTSRAPGSSSGDQKRKKVPGMRSPQVASPCDSLDAMRSRLVDSAAELRVSEGVDCEWENRKNNFGRGSYDGDGQTKASEQPGEYLEHELPYRSKQVKEWNEDSMHYNEGPPDDHQDLEKRQSQQQNRDLSNERYRDAHDPDRDRIVESERRVSSDGNWLDERSRFKEEKVILSRKNVKRPEGKSHLEVDRVCLKDLEARKAEHEEADAKIDARLGVAGKDKLEIIQKADVAEDNMDEPRETRRDNRKGAPDKDFNAFLATATNLKHTADRLKDETATDIYLQAALKFLQGAVLVEYVHLYNETAILFKFTASRYEKANDMAGAILAYKCAAVALFRMLLVKHTSLTKDRADVLAVLQPVNHQATPPAGTGESPSSSSASDLDNLNSQLIPAEKIFSSSGKGSSSVVLPPGFNDTFDRFMKNTGDVFEAFEIWSKADTLLASLVAAKSLSPDRLAAVNKVGKIGFTDVEALVRLVNQALEALGR